MVARGQVLERMVTFAGPDGGVREGLWQGGGVLGDDNAQRACPVLVCPPHPRLGGAMDAPVCTELVWNLGLRRHPTLRFNYSGVGASQGTLAPLPLLPAAAPLLPADLLPLVDDARAALAHLRASTQAARVHVVGVSVGALVAAALVDDADVAVVACVCPPTGVVPVVATGDRARVLVVPPHVGVYVGADDRFVDVDSLVGITPVVIPHANHTFSRGLPQLAAHVCAQLDGPGDGPVDVAVDVPVDVPVDVDAFVVEHGEADGFDDGFDDLDAAGLREKLREKVREKDRGRGRDR